MPDKSATEVIAGVLEAHRWCELTGACICGLLARAGDPARRRKAFPGHVAAEIDKALGGLRRQRRELPAAFNGDLTTYAYRWASGWTPTEHGTEAPD